MSKIIDKYYSWEASGRIPFNGLCNSIPVKYKKTLDRFNPYLANNPNTDLRYLNYPTGYWAREEDDNNAWDIAQRFGPLRQTIVLFMAAIHNEL